MGKEKISISKGMLRNLIVGLIITKDGYELNEKIFEKKSMDKVLKMANHIIEIMVTYKIK